jgi:ribosomal protein L30E
MNKLELMRQNEIIETKKKINIYNAKSNIQIIQYDDTNKPFSLLQNKPRELK